MAVKFLFNPVFAFILFTAGMWLGSTVDPLYGLITILGGCLLGFSPLRREVTTMDRRTKILLFTSLIFLLSLMASGYVLISMFFL